MIKRKTTNQAGFTLVEISLAMAIFTFMLLVVSLAYINIARLYNASTTARNVQQNNRFAMEQITRVARNARDVTFSDVNSEGGVTHVCFDLGASGKQKFYISGTQLIQGSVLACSDPSTDGKVLTSDNSNVRLIKADKAAEGTVTMTIWMVSKVDLLNAGNGLECKSGAGSEFCAINKLTTTVVMRGE